MNADRFIHFSTWFAWRPVKTTNKGWVWLRFVERKDDYRDEVYLGLLPTTEYEAY